MACGASTACSRASVAPQEPPTTSHRAIPSSARSTRRSSSRCGRVFCSMLPAGRLAPAPRWSTQITRQRSGAKKRVSSGEQPDPGPPCSTSAGMPRSVPDSCTFSTCPPDTGSERVRSTRGGGYSEDVNSPDTAAWYGPAVPARIMKIMRPESWPRGCIGERRRVIMAHGIHCPGSLHPARHQLKGDAR